MAQHGQTLGFQGTLPSAPSRTFQRRGVRERPATPGPESVIGPEDRETVEDAQNNAVAHGVRADDHRPERRTDSRDGVARRTADDHHRRPLRVRSNRRSSGSHVRIVATPGSERHVNPVRPGDGDQVPNASAVAVERGPGVRHRRHLARHQPRKSGRLLFRSLTAYLRAQSTARECVWLPRVSREMVVKQLHSRNRIVGATTSRLVYETDTTKGQSGAPVWILDFDGGPPIVVGVHTYGTERTPPGFSPANSRHARQRRDPRANPRLGGGRRRIVAAVDRTIRGHVAFTGSGYDTESSGSNTAP